MEHDPSHGAPLEYGISKEITRVCDEMQLIEELLDLDDQDILELGCGRGEKTRAIAQAGADRRLLALEVDEIQHRLNDEAAALPNVRFALGGAEAIPSEDCRFDRVLLFKSLHHVPVEWMDRALKEIHRVLRPGGLAYLSEPLFRGDLNEILRLFHDESQVRRAAFEAIERAVHSGMLPLVSQTFFRNPVRFAGFEEFERLVIDATHSEHVLSAELHEQVRSKFMQHADEHGASFHSWIRVDLLRKPAYPKRWPAPDPEHGPHR